MALSSLQLLRTNSLPFVILSTCQSRNYADLSILWLKKAADLWRQRKKYHYSTVSATAYIHETFGELHVRL